MKKNNYHNVDTISSNPIISNPKKTKKTKINLIYRSLNTKNQLVFDTFS